jgi:hypothetical protein
MTKHDLVCHHDLSEPDKNDDINDPEIGLVLYSVMKGKLALDDVFSSCKTFPDNALR